MAFLLSHLFFNYFQLWFNGFSWFFLLVSSQSLSIRRCWKLRSPRLTLFLGEIPEIYHERGFHDFSRQDT